MQGVLPKEYYDWINNVATTIGPVSVVFIIFTFALLGGFLITRLCKLAKLPYVLGYLVLGVILGPSLFAVIPSSMITGDSSFAGFSFVGDLALGFIAFGIGKYFNYQDNLKGKSKSILFYLSIALITSLVVGIVTWLIYYVGFNQKELGLVPAFMIGAIAGCISPTATSTIVRQYKAKGPFVEASYLNILVSDITATILFALVMGLTSSGILGGLSGSGTQDVGTVIWTVVKPLLYNLALIAAGILAAWILSLINNYRRTNDSRIILIVAFIAALAAGSSLLHISPLLPCIAFGIFYFNFSKSEALFIQLESFLPPFICIYFVISGAKLNFTNFTQGSALVIIFVVVALRIATQVISSIGLGKAFKQDKKTTRYLPYTMMSMTSVAVGLMSLTSNVKELSTSTTISYIYAIVLAISILFELIGPVLTRRALIKTDSVDPAALKFLTPERKESKTKSPFDF